MRSPLTVLASLAAYIFWHGLPLLQRVLLQPVHQEHPPVEEGEDTEKQALDIATRNLTDCIEVRHLPDGEERRVLCAGLRNFREPWARDFSFAIFGLIDMGEVTTARQGLDVFYRTQLPTGQFPVKVHSTNVLERYLHSLFNRHQPIRAPLRPKYISAHKTISLDGNGLLVIATLNYAERTGDDEFARSRWGQIKRAVEWMEGRRVDADGLLRQGGFSDWADSINRWGAVLYTNVVYWKALDELARAAARWGLDEPEHAQRARRVAEGINRRFWRADLGYYVTSRHFDMLNSDGNLLAVAWGLASREQAHSILKTMERLKMGYPVPTQVADRPYPRLFVGIENHLAGIAHYHSLSSWLWLGAFHVIALARSGLMGQAEDHFARICRVVVRDRVVYEVHGPDGRPLATRWYASEAPLTWNAALIIHAAGVVRRRR